eukprot:TRINITY_DN1323_c0_g1_i1.p2 TRINITY_DN1323_c0_g1~~TRINITY_DN1323_c0_g1_i1.p2  ORF type:complete len:70 (-),score=12.62 TRINITY_DN1323_c0_g1_i1:335-544(-)
MGNEAVQELHSLTKKRAGNLKIKPVFIPKAKRKAQAEKAKQQKKISERKKAGPAEAYSGGVSRRLSAPR